MGMAPCYGVPVVRHGELSRLGCHEFGRVVASRTEEELLGLLKQNLLPRGEVRSRRNSLTIRLEYSIHSIHACCETWS